MKSSACFRVRTSRGDERGRTTRRRTVAVRSRAVQADTREALRVERWSHSTNLQRQNWSQTLLTRGTEYDFTSLRALSASPPTIRASRKNSAPRPLMDILS